MRPLTATSDREENVAKMEDSREHRMPSPENTARDNAVEKYLGTDSPIDQKPGGFVFYVIDNEADATLKA
jgi:hypothetical protein